MDFNSFKLSAKFAYDVMKFFVSAKAQIEWTRFMLDIIMPACVWGVKIALLAWLLSLVWRFINQELEKVKDRDHQRELELRRQDVELKSKEVELKSKEIERKRQRHEHFERKAANKRRRIESDRSLQVLKQPRDELLRHARNIRHGDVDTSVLQELEAIGFESFKTAKFFETAWADVENLADAALSEVPDPMRKAIAAQLHLCTKMRDESEKASYKDGRGCFAKVLVKSEASEFNEKKSFAILAYGMSFDCKKVVSHYTHKTTPYPVFEDQATRVLKSKGWISNEYEPMMTRKYVHTVYIEEDMPHFKQDVLDVGKLQKVMVALEFEASKKAIDNLSCLS